MIEKKAYNQVYKIIEYMPKEMQEKIPNELINAIKDNMDPTYQYEIKEIKEDELFEDTKKILSVLYTDYFSTDEERRIILAKEKNLGNEKEIQKQKMYSVNIKFKDSNKTTTTNKGQIKELTVINKDNYFKRFWLKIKKWLKI